MEKFKNMTDEELVNFLRQYGIQHGPVVGTTRTLYEKKLYEYEQKKTIPGFAGSTYESKYSSRNYDNDDDNYETYEEETVTQTYRNPQTYPRKRDDFLNKSGDNSYQSISQVRHQSSYSQGVEPRRPIRPKPNEVEVKKSARRFLPLWLQLLIFLLFAGYLVYLYCRETKENPFEFLDGSLYQSEESTDNLN
ncbi:emerin [Gastrophryne carolinensis]